MEDANPFERKYILYKYINNDNWLDFCVRSMFNTINASQSNLIKIDIDCN